MQDSKFRTVDLKRTELGTLRTCARVPRARARGARETDPPAFTTIMEAGVSKLTGETKIDYREYLYSGTM